MPYLSSLFASKYHMIYVTSCGLLRQIAVSLDANRSAICKWLSVNKIGEISPFVFL